MWLSTVMKLVCSQFCSWLFIKIQRRATANNFQLTIGACRSRSTPYANNGVLRPLQALDLPEHEHVFVSVVKTTTSGRSQPPKISKESVANSGTPNRLPMSRKSDGGLRKFQGPWPPRSSPTAGNDKSLAGISSR